MAAIGLTQARSMGPVAEAVARAGGSMARIFARADLPLRLVDHPDRLIPLRDQLTLVECAMREIGDATMPVWLSGGAGVAWLGPFGQHVRAAPTLGTAIRRTNELIATRLQSATELRLAVQGRRARWSYRVTDRVSVGRQTNELLAFGYMLDLIRNFAGTGWGPDHLVVPGRLASPAAIELALRGSVADGAVACIVLPAELLSLPNPRLADVTAPDPLPDGGDTIGMVSALACTCLLLESRARIEWVARHMGISRRSLQRQLAASGTDFHAVTRNVLRRQACAMLQAGATATQVAGELGYADPAHFSRAFLGWTGRTPRTWQRQCKLVSNSTLTNCSTLSN
jgi:AraC-like DNA-binding protein